MLSTTLESDKVCIFVLVLVDLAVVGVVGQSIIAGRIIIVYIQIEVLSLPKREVQLCGEESVILWCDNALQATPRLQLLADLRLPSERATPIRTRNLDAKPFFGSKRMRSIGVVSGLVRCHHHLSSIDCCRPATSTNAFPQL